MAQIFLDANCLIDVFGHRDEDLATLLDPHQLNISALSLHIFAYVEKLHMPTSLLSQISSLVHVVNLTSMIINHSSQGPTPDFEDNIQLHSAVAIGCQYFLTRDVRLLNMKQWREISVISPEQLPSISP